MKNIADKKLLTLVDELRKKERQTLSSLLDHLREVHRRRLYCDLGYGSLYKYLVKHLGYSEGGACRRIKALKLTATNPEAQKMIASGELNLTTACLAQNFLTKEKVCSTKLLQTLKHKTVDETKRELAAMGQCSNAKPKEIKRYIDSDNVRVAWNLKKATYDKFQIIRDRLKIDDAESLIERLVDQYLEIEDKKLKRFNKSCGSEKSRTIPAKTKKKLLLRANQTCEYLGCDERRFLEVDHIVPVGLGGGNGLNNLQILCKAHNQRQAIKHFGVEYMGSFLFKRKV